MLLTLWLFTSILSLGGAEQLVVNAAVALQRHGHNVSILTSHHDISHSFAETRDKGIWHESRGKDTYNWGFLYLTLLPFLRLLFVTGPLASCVNVAGDWLPRQIFGHFTALCAAIRMVYLSMVIAPMNFLRSSGKTSQRPDIIFCDGVSAMIPFLRLFGYPVSSNRSTYTDRLASMTNATAAPGSL